MIATTVETEDQTKEARPCGYIYCEGDMLLVYQTTVDQGLQKRLKK